MPRGDGRQGPPISKGCPAYGRGTSGGGRKNRHRQIGCHPVRNKPPGSQVEGDKPTVDQATNNPWDPHSIGREALATARGKYCGSPDPDQRNLRLDRLMARPLVMFGDPRQSPFLATLSAGDVLEMPRDHDVLRQCLAGGVRTQCSGITLFGGQPLDTEMASRICIGDLSRKAGRIAALFCLSP